MGCGRIQGSGKVSLLNDCTQVVGKGLRAIWDAQSRGHQAPSGSCARFFGPGGLGFRFRISGRVNGSWKAVSSVPKLKSRHIT